jgi:hypothetical protein
VLGEIMEQSYHYLRMKFRLHMLCYLTSKKSLTIRDNRSSLKGARINASDTISEESFRSKST